MSLTPPISQYVEGEKPSHSSKARLHVFVKAFPQRTIDDLLVKGGYLTSEGKPTRKSLDEGLVEVCENKALWNLSKTRKALAELSRPPKRDKKNVKPITKPVLQRVRTEPAWVDFETIGTYFGVGKIQVGKWVDQLGLRAVPEVQVNESGAVDMLDMANQAKEKQSNGFIGKKPTQKALDGGFAQVTIITGKKDKEFEIVKWNLDLVKAALVKAGHPLDTERKMMLKGKGKNSDVKVETMDDRIKRLYSEWYKLQKSPATRKSSWDVFKNQPKIVLSKVEVMMGKPEGYISRKDYLR